MDRISIPLLGLEQDHILCRVNPSSQKTEGYTYINMGDA